MPHLTKKIHRLPADGAASLSVKSDRIGELYEISAENTLRLIVALRRATNGADFLEMGIRAICAQHHQSRRAEAIAAAMDVSESTGVRISRHETSHMEAWPLVIAGWIPFVSLSGAVEGLAATTGLSEAQCLDLIDAALGPRVKS